MAARLDDFVSEHGRRPSPRPTPKAKAKRRGVRRIVAAAVTTVFLLARAFARRRANDLVAAPA